MPRYALAQINVTVGDLAGNAARIRTALAEVEAHRPDLVIFPELTIAGYPPEDLLLKPGFRDACERVFQELVPQVRGAALIGYPARGPGGALFNTAALVRDGAVQSVYYKHHLPNYAVFDEERYFQHGTEGRVFDVGGEPTGVVICEDAWKEDGPARSEAAAGARTIACLSASPFYRGKHQVREKTFARLCTRHRVWFLYANLVGGQDELVFDGGSLVMDPQGRVVLRAPQFVEDLLVFDLTPTGVEVVAGEAGAPLAPAAEVYGALVLGVRDYVRKNGFAGVVIGISGGIDSALTAAIAVDALGPENVLGVTMPSRYSSVATRSDAELLARNLGIRLLTLPVEKPHEAFYGELGSIFAGVHKEGEDLTDQNLQARIRAVYLMALSNKFGHIVLNTSNKSESAVGYGTLYGDMIGGFAVIKDVFKMHVWELARHVNACAGRERIPQSTIERVPTAELRDNQEDRQSIPDYPLLDPVLELYIEQDMTYAEIVAAGHDPDVVRRAIGLVDKNEFKRRQAVMGVRVTTKAFGKDRRLPVTNRFRQW